MSASLPAQQAAHGDVRNQPGRQREAHPRGGGMQCEYPETGRGAEQQLSKAGKRPEEEELQRVDKIVHQLQGGKIEPEHDRRDAA